jgi:CheY-like chemotaxis protein
MASNRLLHGSTVLVVEDEPIVAFEVVSLMRLAGATVSGPAASLVRALELANSERFDCAVLDVRLRGGLVFPVASILSQQGAGLVFYTAYDDLEGLQRDWPSAQVLLKPAPPKLLVQAVKMICK